MAGFSTVEVLAEIAATGGSPSIAYCVDPSPVRKGCFAGVRTPENSLLLGLGVDTPCGPRVVKSAELDLSTPVLTLSLEDVPARCQGFGEGWLPSDSLYAIPLSALPKAILTIHLTGTGAIGAWPIGTADVRDPLGSSQSLPPVDLEQSMQTAVSIATDSARALAAPGSKTTLVEFAPVDLHTGWASCVPPRLTAGYRIVVRWVTQSSSDSVVYLASPPSSVVKCTSTGR